MQQASYYDTVQAQDNLRPVRNFVSLLAGAVNEQTWAGEDAYPVSVPGQVQVRGPNGYAVEGKPAVIAGTAPGQAIHPGVLLVGLALLAYAVMK